MSLHIIIFSVLFSKKYKKEKLNKKFAIEDVDG